MPAPPATNPNLFRILLGLVILGFVFYSAMSDQKHSRPQRNDHPPVVESPDDESPIPGDSSTASPAAKPTSPKPPIETPRPEKYSSETAKPGANSSPTPKVQEPKASESLRKDKENPVTEQTSGRVIVHKQQIRTLEGEIFYKGEIDLTDTLARIAAGKRLRYNNDGSVFQNRERRLPQKPSGYYHEWVHETKGLSGPGPQRIITGENGEIYYTANHYRTFQNITPKEKAGR